MPFTQVTLVNGSDKPATAHIHVNEEVGAEGWIEITAAKGETKVAVTEAQEPLVKIYATHPHVGHNSTRVIRGKKEINMTEPVHVPVIPNVIQYAIHCRCKWHSWYLNIKVFNPFLILIMIDRQEACW